jgi:hypothetical protein
MGTECGYGITPAAVICYCNSAQWAYFMDYICALSYRCTNTLRIQWSLFSVPLNGLGRQIGKDLLVGVQ